MPSKELIRNSSITETMLSPHLRNRINRNGGNIATSTFNDVQYNYTIELAEVVEINMPIALNNEGKGVLAKDNAESLLPVFGINKSANSINGIVAVYDEGDVITIDNANFIIGKPVFLSNGDIPYTTTFNYTSNKIAQVLGTAISEISFKLKIEEAIIME